MIKTILANEQGHLIDNFEYDASNGPQINLSSIVGGSKDQLGCPIAPGTNISKISLALIQHLCRSKITKNQFPVLNQHIMGFNISMANIQTMNVR